MKLREAYESVKNHPFRVDRIGSPRDYGEAIINLVDVFEVDLKNKFFDGVMTLDLAFEVGHDFHSIGYHFNSYGDSIIARKKTLKDYELRIKHDMLVVERYLHQVHAYIDTGVFVQWKGYYAGCNPHPGWYTLKFNPETKKFKQINWVEDNELTRFGQIKAEARYCPECNTGELTIIQFSTEGKTYGCDNCNYNATEKYESN